MRRCSCGLLFILGCLWISLAGCGIKAPPVSLSTIVPKRILDLAAIPREGQLVLVWTIPKENTDKTVLTDLEKFQITRSEGDLIGDSCRGCGEAFKVIEEMRADSSAETRGKKVSVTIQDQQAKKVYVYEVVSVNQKGYAGAASNPVTVYWDYPPSAPTRVNAEAGDKRVDLSWEPVMGATGYNLYRRGEEEKVFPFNPLNRSSLVDTKYTDLGVENEKRYIYSVRAVKQVVKTEVEGKGSLPLPVTPRKRIPPSAPSDLAAVPLKEGIELNWRRNPEPDILGYNVYRRKVGEEKFKKLNETPLTAETYLDKDVQMGEEYDYAVTAVDTSPRHNESSPSEEIRTKYVY